tara:strand:+ start:536 stop:841 length:306 start_codon:yes stop_codon:yes gene_type:complete
MAQFKSLDAVHEQIADFIHSYEGSAMHINTGSRTVNVVRELPSDDDSNDYLDIQFGGDTTMDIWVASGSEVRWSFSFEDDAIFSGSLGDAYIAAVTMLLTN